MLQIRYYFIAANIWHILTINVLSSYQQGVIKEYGETSNKVCRCPQLDRSRFIESLMFVLVRRLYED